MAVAAGDLKPVEAVDLAEADILGHVPHFSRDHVECLVEVKAQGWVEVRRRLDVIDPLPTVDHGELGPFGGHHRGQRRGLGGPRSGTMLMREVEAEFVLVVFDGLERRQFHIGMAGEAAWINDPGVIAGFPVNDLLGQQPTVPPALAQTCAQADDAKGIALARDRANQWRAVDGIGDRAVDDGPDAGFGQCGHTLKGTFEHVHHPLKIIRTKGVDEIRVDPVHPPSFAVLLIKADQQAVLFLSAVVIGNRTAQQGHAMPGLGDGGNVLGQKILVLH